MKLVFVIPMMLAAFDRQTAGQASELVTGRTYYTQGEFRKAAAHFELALKADPNDAESHYWLGMSYQILADIAMPFDRKYNARARVYLTRAAELAPDRPEYRRDLFEFLLNSASSSPSALRQAGSMLPAIAESDSDSAYMRRGFENESRANSSLRARLGRLFLAVPRAAYRIAELRTAFAPSPPIPR